MFCPGPPHTTPSLSCHPMIQHIADLASSMHLHTVLMCMCYLNSLVHLLACRNVHPTTSLLLPFTPPSPRSASMLPPGILVFSSRSLVLLSCPPAAALPSAASLVPPPSSSSFSSPSVGRADLALAASAAAAGSPLPSCRRRLLQWALPGIPACAEWLAPGLLVLGDSMAGESKQKGNWGGRGSYLSFVPIYRYTTVII